jgi:hypothetical protein
MTRVLAAWTVLALVPALAGCPAKEPARFGATALVQADGVYPPPPGATLEVTAATARAITMPAEAVARLAIARDVPWSEVEELVATLEGHGKTPVLLVGQRQHTRAIALRDPIAERYITVLAFADGKACVRAPGEEAAKCVASPDNHYVEKAFVRQLVREARERLALDDVAVEVAPVLPWGDVVNALDGARTCCGDAPMRVAVRTQVDDGTTLVPVE